MGSNDRDWELEEGLPQVEDPFFQQYLKGRDALIAEERKRRHGARSSKSFSKTDILRPSSRRNLPQVSIADRRSCL